MGGDIFRFGRDEPEFLAGQGNNRARGYLLVDGKEVASTLQCCHCNKHWIPVKGSGNTRGFCVSCMKTTCGAVRCDVCIPFEKRLDLFEKGLLAVLSLMLALFMGSPAHATPPVITPSIPTVFVSSNVVLTSNQTVTFSLQSGSTGTLSGATATTVVYNAPGPILAKQSYYGCPLTPQDSIISTRIDALPVDVATTTYLHTIVAGGAQIAAEVDMPDNLYSNATASTTMVFNYTPGANGQFKLLPWQEMRVENGVFSDKDVVDQHILGIDKDTCIASELYKLYPIGTQSDCLSCNSQSGVKYVNQYPINLGVSAGGLPIIPLSVGYQELKNCADNGVPISHAMRMTFGIGVLANGHKWPAVAHATDGGQILFGTRFRLMSSFTNTGSAPARCIETALKNYGVIADDGGINGHIQFRQDAVGDFAMLQALGLELFGITGLDTDHLEAVDESSLEDTDPASPTAHTSRTNPVNPYVTPDQYAVVIASNTSTHESSYMPIIVQPVTIGTDRPLGYNMIANGPQIQLNVWVHGAVDTAFTCSMVPTMGTLTSGGLYTPPASSVVRSSAVVTCAATADAGALINFPIYVYPADGIRVRLANAADITFGPDVNGKTWFPERGATWRLQGHANCDWDGETWPGVVDSGIYRECEYVNSGSGDLFYKAILPNGTYRITLWFAIGGGSAPFSRGSWADGIDSQSIIYTGNSATTIAGNGPWTQMGIVGKQIDICDITGACASRLPGSVVLDRTVSDNNLYFAIRHIPGWASELNAFSITQISGAPVNHGRRKVIVF